eukprot:6801607-Pyramimonas_sp.AAC.1
MPELVEFSAIAPANTKRDPLRAGPSTIQMRKLGNIISRLMQLAAQLSRSTPDRGHAATSPTLLQRLCARRLWDK